MTAVGTPVIPVPEPRPSSAAAALLTGFAFLMVGNGLGGSVVGIRAELESFDTVATGVIMAAYFAGFLAGSRLAMRSLAQVGHIRVFAALASLASTAALVHAVAVFPAVWVAMRFLTGLCMAGLYVVAESWLNDIATPQTRGRLLALYMVVSMGGVAVGQLLLTTADPGEFTLFIVASVLVSVSLVPVSLSTTSAPPIDEIERLSMRELIAIVPTGTVSMFFVGMSAGTLLGMGAVYATRVGLSSNEVALFIGASIVGAVVFQWPIGILSDRVPRRGLLGIVAATASAISLTLTIVDAGTAVATGLMLLLGGTMFPLYSLSIAYTNDWIPSSKMVAASSSLVIINGLGAVLGPLLTAGAFVVVGTQAFFWILAGTHAAIATYVGYRVVVRDPLPMERQRAWVPMPSRATAAISVLARPRRTRAPQDPNSSDEAVQEPAAEST